MRQRFRAAGVAAALVGALSMARPAGADEGPEELAYRQILVTWRGLRGSDATRTKEEARALAEAVRAEAARPGADVAAVAAARSEGLARGGFVDFTRFYLAEAFVQAVRSLPVGGVSPVFETDLGWNVVQRVSREEALRVLEATSAAFVGARVTYAGTLDPVAGRTRAQALADARSAVAAMRSGTRFEELPAALRVVPYSKKGWLAKTLRKATALPEYRAIEDAAFATPIGDVSDPVDSPLGWVFLRRVPWFHAHVKHLVVAHLQAQNVPPAVRRSRTQARERAESLLARLKVDPGAWGQLVAEASDEVATSQVGGDLGVLEPGEHVPELEAAVAATKPGTIQGVVETRFGFEILYRVD